MCLFLALSCATSQAGLFDGDKPLAPVAEPFDFATVQSDPAKLLPAYLEVSSKGDGISKLKKVVVAAVEVRFRKDLGAEAVSVNAAAEVEKQLHNDPVMFQRLTDNLYTRLVKELTEHGMTVADVSVLAAEPEYQEGRATAKPSGHEEKFGNLSVVNQRDKEGGEQSGSSIFGRMGNDFGGVPYYVYYATQTPGLNYDVMFGDGARMTEPLTQHPIKLLRAADNVGVDVITVGFDVRLSKFARSETKGISFNSAKVAVTPMLRTQLLAMRVMSSEGGKQAYPPNIGIQIVPHNRGTKRKGLMGALTNGALTGYAWIEQDGDGVLSSSEGHGITPVAGGFEQAFEKNMDAQVRLLMAAIDTQRSK